MITANESQDIFDIGKYYVILPNKELILRKRKQYKRFTKFRPVKYGFTYSSKDNPEYLNLMDLKRLVKKHLKK